ncbi:GTP-binding protein, partial [Caldilinea sp.]|uniref:GTP-binding protein n=1 Tax=Caldilinea sp. TaxID=2293560 RepID=UPI002C0E30F8|nr:GTP-binding protein [Caldilinea sp.]
MHIIGTAGHVDHGKSTLVRALTGIDPDRLKEEKARGMTIDLGFAWIELPDAAGGAHNVGIVDVPGHIDFIKNMLAGVGGVDAALLVIAADEGVMPQTREHLAILDLLAVPAAVVALTKVDLIDDPAWLELPPQERNRSFPAKPLWQRALIVAAGPAINLLFAAVILGGFAYVYGENVTPAKVTAVEPGSAAERAGLRPRDRIRAVDGEPVALFA